MVLLQPSLEDYKELNEKSACVAASLYQPGGQHVDQIFLDMETKKDPAWWRMTRTARIIPSRARRLGMRL